MPLSSRLSAFAQRLGINSRQSRQILERASLLRMDFPEVQADNNLWWQSGPQFQQLIDLPHGALAGPVQEDKAAARAALIRVVEAETETLETLDLREIDGLDGSVPDGAGAACSLEEYVAGLSRRQVRIISYRDFRKVFDDTLGAGEEPIALRQADWRGSRRFCLTESPEALASAIVYARYRALEIRLPARVTRYRFAPGGLENLAARYHMLLMPVSAWAHPGFMALLLDSALPYARLVPNGREGVEYLLLPKGHPDSSALGTGLLLAGAPDMVEQLLQWQGDSWY